MPTTGVLAADKSGTRGKEEGRGTPAIDIEDSESLEGTVTIDRWAGTYFATRSVSGKGGGEHKAAGSISNALDVRKSDVSVVGSAYLISMSEVVMTYDERQGLAHERS